jgi:hypothetical protein
MDLTRSLQLARAKATLSQDALNEAEATIDLLTEALAQAESKIQFYEKETNNKDQEKNIPPTKRREQMEIAMSLRELCRTIESLCGIPDQESFDGRRNSYDPNQSQMSPQQMSLQERSIEAEHLLKRYAKQAELETSKAVTDAQESARIASAATDDVRIAREAQATALTKFNRLLTSSSAKSTAKEMKTLKKSKKRIVELENDVRDMQDEILATHRAQTENALHLTAALADLEHHKQLIVDTNLQLQKRTELFLPLLFAVRHVVSQYHLVKTSEPTVNDLLKKIHSGKDFIVFDDNDNNNNTGNGGSGGGGGSGGNDENTNNSISIGSPSGDIRHVTKAAQNADGSMNGVLPSENEIDELCADLSKLLKDCDCDGNNFTANRSSSSEDTYKVAEQMLLQAKLQRQSATLREENLHDEIERLETMNQELRNQLDDMKDAIAVMNLNNKLLQFNGGINSDGIGGGGSSSGMLLSSPPPQKSRQVEDGQTLQEEIKALRDYCEEAMESGGEFDGASSDEDEEDEDEDDFDSSSGEDATSFDEEEEEEEEILQAPSMLSSERFLR